MLTCDKCGSTNIRVRDKRNNAETKEYIRRVRKCIDCNNVFATVEITRDKFESLIDRSESLDRLKKIFEKY